MLYSKLNDKTQRPNGKKKGRTKKHRLKASTNLLRIHSAVLLQGHILIGDANQQVLSRQKQNEKGMVLAQR